MIASYFHSTLKLFLVLPSLSTTISCHYLVFFQCCLISVLTSPIPPPPSWTQSPFVLITVWMNQTFCLLFFKLIYTRLALKSLWNLLWSCLFLILRRLIKALTYIFLSWPSDSEPCACQAELHPCPKNILTVKFGAINWLSSTFYSSKSWSVSLTWILLNVVTDSVYNKILNT